MPQSRTKPVDAEIRVVEMTPDDWPMVRAIYEAGIATGDATFQTEAPTWEAWDRSHLPTCRLVARNGSGEVSGWAALSAVSARPVYSGVVEVSVYVASDMRGRGVGRALLEALITASEGDDRWTLQAGIFPENEASLVLHRSCGFRVVGRRERLGQLDGIWRDVMLLERRSGKVGQPGAAPSSPRRG
jgi:phosphinothricin acetyltransferase